MIHAYSYIILRYVHDVTSGEFLNIGVALYAPDAPYVGAKCRSTYGRLSSAFPGMDGKALRRLMQYIQLKLREAGKRLSEELALERKPASIAEIARSVMPQDDSALQWSPAGGGLTSDPAAELDKLYERMVARHDERVQHQHRSDDDIWKDYRNSLAQRNVLQYLQPKVIAVQDDEVEFKYAWRNGVWHCLEPLSFDLSTADGIRDKAHRWLGQLTSVRETEEDFKVIFLIGAPRETALKEPFEKALSILGKIPVANEIIGETEARCFADRLANDIARHEANA